MYLHRPMNSSFVTQVLWVWGLSLVSSYFPLKETAIISETLQNRSLFLHNMVQLPNEQKMDDCYLRGLVGASEEHDAPIFMVGGRRLLFLRKHSYLLPNYTASHPSRQESS